MKAVYTTTTTSIYSRLLYANPTKLTICNAWNSTFTSNFEMCPIVEMSWMHKLWVLFTLYAKRKAPQIYPIQLTYHQSPTNEILFLSYPNIQTNKAHAAYIYVRISHCDSALFLRNSIILFISFTQSHQLSYLFSTIILEICCCYGFQSITVC